MQPKNDILNIRLVTKESRESLAQEVLPRVARVFAQAAARGADLGALSPAHAAEVAAGLGKEGIVVGRALAEEQYRALEDEPICVRRNPAHPAHKV